MLKDQKSPRDITDWLNLEHECHVRALKRYWENGKWPKGFLPKEITFKDGWISIVERTWPDIVATFKPFYLDRRLSKPIREKTKRSRRYNCWDEAYDYD